MSKNIVVYNANRYADDVWLPVLWAQSKTYYEKHSQFKDWKWHVPLIDACGNDIEEIKKHLLEIQPNVFAISLYVWNYQQAHTVAQWVNETWPDCLIVSGGPHQYIKHRADWFAEHPYIDASLPSDSYGEMFFTELLDQLSSNQPVKWNTITDAVYATKGGTMLTSKYQSSPKSKKSYDYNWSAYLEQKQELTTFVEFARKSKNVKFMSAILETTRGCPYGCTYCDWGGGTSTSVITKDISNVKQDIESLSDFNLDFIYIADANFGIFDERDISIIKYLSHCRKVQFQSFTIGYGGFAKTKNKLDTISKIIKYDMAHQMSSHNEVKMSMQTLDKEVLKNIDRKNIDFDEYVNTIKRVLPTTPLYVELMLGLPGITTDKFYKELSIIGSYNISVVWYPWILLPEAPAYSAAYREQHGITTVIKNAGWDDYVDDSLTEIVIGGNSFTTDEYMEMCLSSSIYKMFIQGGVYSKSLNWILTNRSKQIGDIICAVYNDFVKNDCYNIYNTLQQQWQEILVNPEQPCIAKYNEIQVYFGIFFAILLYQEPDQFSMPLGNFLHTNFGVPRELVNEDAEMLVTVHTLDTIVQKDTYSIDYRKDFFVDYQKSGKVIRMINSFSDSGQALVGKRKTLWLNKVLHWIKNILK